MKRILTLSLLLLVSIGLTAQEINRTLMITEARFDLSNHAYLELTNMGSEALNLSDFEIGRLSAWDAPPFPGWPEAQQVDRQNMERLPDHILQPSESFVLASIYEYTQEQYDRDVANFEYSIIWAPATQPEMTALANLQVHKTEALGYDPSDSISFVEGDPYATYDLLLDTWNGRDVLFIRHHASPTISAVVDQVGGIFTDADGTNPNEGYIDVAGIAGATGNSILVRRFDVVEGNTEFVRGTDLASSEWIPIPRHNFDGHEPMRSPFWTVGNHVNQVLDENTLISSTVDVDWTAGIINVPWGLRNGDSIMSHFEKVPGLAWHYYYSEEADDIEYVSIRNNDLLDLYACGNELQQRTMTLVVADPPANANIVIPKYRVTNGPNQGLAEIPYKVSDGVPGLDTISKIPFACRVDSLFLYLEKASNASWEIIWIDGNERTDLKEGDILRVTAEDGFSVKDYYLKLRSYWKGVDADLVSITWPDIPAFFRNTYGWMGDTIPGFNPVTSSYVIKIPSDQVNIPSLVCKTRDPNARVEVERATSLDGSLQDRTIVFRIIAECDTVLREYSILLDKIKNNEEIQPWLAKPFISQYTWQTEFDHSLLEIVNPGTQVLDLSNYLIFFGAENDIPSIFTNWNTWENRYQKYIPGYKWQDYNNWLLQPQLAILDLYTNPFIEPGEVFVLSEIDLFDEEWEDYPFMPESDIDFRHLPWGESYGGMSAAHDWSFSNLYLFEILNDSVLMGLKSASDPNDFALVDVFGMGDGSAFAPVGFPSEQTSSYTRKSHVYQGNPVFQGSFGSTPEESEWILTDENSLKDKGYPWPQWRVQVPEGTGSHYMDEVAFYQSTINSLVYKVSPGYSMDESIRGVITGTTVEQFLDGILKKEEGQVLTVFSGQTEITGEGLLSNGDFLEVLSADQSNSSRYILEVSENGLSDDAILASSIYTVAIDPASISNFSQGTLLREIIEGVTVPNGATMVSIDENGAYLPLQCKNFEGEYVDLLATDNCYLEVTAEDGQTRIIYQLLPDSNPSDAFVSSFVLDVYQESNRIGPLPYGISVSSLMESLIPSTGASMSLEDKFGFERTLGSVMLDDQLIVRSADGSTTRTYLFTDGSGCFEPIWGVNPADFAFNGQVTAKVFIDGIPVTDGLLATFVGGECRGVSNAGYFSPADHYVFEVICFSNVASGEIMEFKYFDPGTCSVYEPLMETVEFVSDMTVGNAMTPFEVHYINQVQFNKELTTGWNWFSINAHAGDMSLGNLLSCGAGGDYIKNQVVSSTYYDDFGWFGDLAELEAEDLYKIKVSAPCSIDYWGIPADVQSLCIDLLAGWNWVGFLPECNMSLSEAFSGLNLQQGDYIKNQVASSTYYANYGWYGNLTELIPGEGYMVKMGADDLLCYTLCPPSPPAAQKSSGALHSPAFTVDQHQFAYNGSVTARVFSNGIEISSENNLLLAYAGDELRGVSKGVYFEPTDAYSYPLMVFSNLTDGEEISFKLYNTETGMLSPCIETIEFTNDMIISDAFESFELNLNSSLGMESLSTNGGLSMKVYPNPFKDRIKIDYSTDETTTVRITVYDMTGRTIEILDSRIIDPGSYSTEWNAEAFPQGAYLLKLSTGSNSIMRKIVLIK